MNKACYTRRPGEEDLLYKATGYIRLIIVGARVNKADYTWRRVNKAY